MRNTPIQMIVVVFLMLSLFQMKFSSKILCESIRIIRIIKVSNTGVNLEKLIIFLKMDTLKYLKIIFKLAPNQPPNSY